MATVDLITLAEAKNWLGISGATHDTKLTALATAVSLRLEKWCGTKLVQGTVTSEKHTGGSLGAGGGFRDPIRGGGKRLFLKNMPIVSITSIVDTQSTPAEVTDVDYLIWNDEGIVEHRAFWPVPFDSNTNFAFWLVTYVAGYFANTAGVDENVKLAARMLLARYFKDVTPGVKSKSIATFSVTYETLAGELPDEVKSLMGEYRRRIVG